MDTKYHLLVLAICLFILLFSSSPSDGFRVESSVSYKLVNEFCNRKGTGMKKAFCLDILKSDPRTAYINSYFTLFNITMDQALTNVTNIRTYFNNVRLFTPQLYRSLNFCVSRYDTVIKIIRGAIRQVDTGKSDVDAVSYDVALTYIYASQCKKKMDDDGVRDVALGRESGVVMDHTRVCYAVAIALANAETCCSP